MTNPRNDIFAVLGGVSFGADAVRSDGTVRLSRTGSVQPNDPRFSYDETWDVWEAVVPIDECDRLVEVSTFARYQGAPCQVIAIGEDGQAGLYYVGHDSIEPERLGFEEFDRHEYRKTVPTEELYDYHEIHRDLLFNHWRAKAFGEVKV